jgi:hypothetical protein
MLSDIRTQLIVKRPDHDRYGDPESGSKARPTRVAP